MCAMGLITDLPTFAPEKLCAIIDARLGGNTFKTNFRPRETRS
jgi:hypothetical protein